MEAREELERVAIACTGMCRELFTRASFLFPGLTKPQTGRLNKSPHTVHAIETRHRRQGPNLVSRLLTRAVLCRCRVA